MKSVRIRSYAGPHFPAFGLNTKHSPSALSILAPLLLLQPIFVKVSLYIVLHTPIITATTRDVL